MFLSRDLSVFCLSFNFPSHSVKAEQSNAVSQETEEVKEKKKKRFFISFFSFLCNPILIQQKEEQGSVETVRHC